MSEPTPRPHIVLITLDQWRYDAAGFAGNDVVRTPHLDGLAGDGLVFDAAYTSSPLCIPARASLMLGQFGSHFGWQPTERWAEGGAPTLPRLLASAGYRTSAVGKMHFVPFGQSHGFENMVLCEHGEPEYYENDDYHPWLREQGYTDDFELWQFPRNYHLGTDDFRSALQALPSPLPESAYSTSWIADRAIETIEAHDVAEPMFLWLSFLKPHHPFDPPKPWCDLYDPAEVSLPDTDVGALDRLPEPAREALLSRTAHGAFDLSAMDDDRLRRIVSYYYATITHVDHHIGRVVAALERRGMADDAAYCVTSDHGEFLGHRGQLFKDHRDTLLYEDLVRVPLTLTLPRRSEGRRVGHRAEPVQHVDVLPTIADLAGVADDHQRPGRSLLRPGDPDRPALVESPTGRSAALRLGRFKYVYDPRDELQQLYDLAVDPGERSNLAADPRSAPDLELVHQRLFDVWQPSTRQLEDP